MKHVLLFVTLFTATWCKAQTNVYHPFLHENVKWSSLLRVWYELDIDTTNAFFRLCADGDTLFDGKQYIKVMITSDECPGSFYSLIREDIEERKVFVNYFEPGQDTLLFDFSLDAGQSVNHCYSFAHFDSSKVINIDSVFIGDNYRKKFVIACHKDGVSDTTFWIEGIGGVFGASPGSSGFEFFGYGYTGSEPLSKGYLVCYRENGTVLFEEPQTLNLLGEITEIDCDYTVPITEFNVASEITIYPNPNAGDVLYVVTENALTYTIVSLSGQILRESGTYNNEPIYIGDLSPGLYILQLYYAAEIITAKHFLKL